MIANWILVTIHEQEKKNVYIILNVNLRCLGLYYIVIDLIKSVYLLKIQQNILSHLIDLPEVTQKIYIYYIK